MDHHAIKKAYAPVCSLFFSGLALVSGGIPALFEASGKGGEFADFAAAYPKLIWLSVFKYEFFIIAGILLAVIGYLQFKNHSRLSAAVWGLSAIVFLTGIFFTFIAPDMLFADHP